MKKKLFVVAVLVLILAILGTGTMAYYTAKTTAHNVITTDGVSIVLEEYRVVDNKLEPYPDETLPAMPGLECSKIVQVRCLDADAYIRMNVDIVILDAEGKTMDLTAAEKNRVVKLDFNKEKWLSLAGDTSPWYYKTALTGGEATAPLFTTVTFDGPAMGNEFQGATVKVIVSAQALQARNNPIPEGGTTADVQGWPEA